MEKEYFILKRLEKKFIKKFLHKQKNYKNKKRLSAFFWILSSIGLGMMVFSFLTDLDKYIMLMLLGFVMFLGCVMGSYIGFSAYKKYGDPFSYRRGKCIRIGKEYIDYFYFHDIDTRSGYDARYRIWLKNIKDIRYNSEDHIISINGKGNQIMYYDYLKGKINEKVYIEGWYDIISTVENENELVEELSKLMK